MLVVSVTNTNSNDKYIRFNADSGSNYSRVSAGGDGTTTYSSAATTTSLKEAYYDAQTTYQIMDYSATDKHKSVLQRSNTPSAFVAMQAGRWASTSAITEILVSANNAFAAGSSFSLFGIAA